MRINTEHPAGNHCDVWRDGRREWWVVEVDTDEGWAEIVTLDAQGVPMLDEARDRIVTHVEHGAFELTCRDERLAAEYGIPFRVAA